MNCIETKHLTHRFSDQIVLNDIDLQIPEGSIYGFLGPNGAGKTTTLRLILGLLKKQKGDICIFNEDFSDNRISILKNTGSLIESPSLYGHLTAYQSLQILQKIYQCPLQRIEEVLQLVGLANTGKKKASQFSLGMKQRLSIAMALLHDPKLLILDEPTNGLDPNGIIEIRELLKKLNAEKGMTIVVSSHLLSEIEKMVTHVGIIHKGSLLFQGTLAELHVKQNTSNHTLFETNAPQQSIDLLNQKGITASREETKIILHSSDKELISTVNALFIQQGIKVYQISSVKNDLESIFIDLVKN
jgi:ABC-2 type transport system ATP-binding protein